ncbi:CoA pyrophosphatase [Salinisphaera sp.]|uniref:CoA pyrophosphatase n=1 Tax=Salinisphaera sp. TaxID=1914330 RepID=UPI002D77E061|nr:CoA pyrophosphatase [Salinisphaera sp.]HET7312868.1 CoA pyrophosphatase [Salinisphaera sp.]
MPKNSSPDGESSPGLSPSSWPSPWPDPWGRLLREALAIEPDSVARGSEPPVLPPAAERGWPAAVLIAVEAGEQPGVYFTQRAADLKHHPGQISFPGGRVEPGDSGTAAAALREAREEIGLDSRCVHLIGQLPPHHTTTGFRITPHVAWIDAGVRLEPDGAEVARLFSVPLAHALEPANYRTTRRVRDGAQRLIYSLDFQDDHIWGATAAILIELVRRVARVRQRDFAVAQGE